MEDWFILGIIIGPRLSEWAQRSDLNTQGIQLNVDKTPKAFIKEDFEFRGPNNCRLSDPYNTPLPAIDSVKIRWRYQKNGQNNQKITVTKNI